MKHNNRRSNLLLVILRVALVLALLHVPGAGRAQEQSWITYTNVDNGYSISYPSNWFVHIGNEHAPSLPANIVSFQSAPGVFDITVIPFRKENRTLPLSDTLRAAVAAYWGDFTEADSDITTLRAKGVTHALFRQPIIENVEVDLLVAIYSENEIGYLFVTPLTVDPISKQPRTPSDIERLRIFEHTLDSFATFAKSPGLELLPLPDVTISTGNTEPAAVTATFQWPTAGYIGYIYRRPVSYAPYHNGIDIWTNTGGGGNQGSKGNAVYLPYKGRVTWIYTDPRNVQQGIRIEHNINGSKIWTHYWHMADEYSGQSYIEGGINNQEWDTNKLLGYQGNRRWSGGDIITHLHLTVANGSADSNDIDPSPYFDTKLNWNDSGHIGWHYRVERGGSSSSCPSDNNVVILYKHHNHDCGGGGDGDGYVKANRNSSTQMPGGFGASSIRIPSGWYARVFERNGNGKRLYTNNDSNFDGDFFDNGHPVNDRVGGVEVGDSLVCAAAASPENCLPPNRAPNKPSPSSPGDWYVARDSRAPTLCWNNNGDPDGDSVEFYAEVFESAKGANSGWTRETCWRPGDLDGNYFNYQWRVKAKDSRGAESGWSDVRHFTIEAPNQPPTISFDTANGNGDSRITTREQNWTLRGTAGDPENRFSRVEFKCDDCDNRGSGDDRSTSTNWSITRNGMSGRNYVYFEAFDDKQGKKSDKTLELNIDLAAPTTEAQIIGNAPYGWFTEPAQVRLNTRDNGTGRAVADVKEVRYWRDGGNEQVQPGATVNFSEGGDGEHTVRFYAVDNVGNVESERSQTYRVDRTPPTAIGGVSETSGVANNQWQKAQNRPTFRWNASTDPTPGSGLGGYQLYFGQDASGAAVHKDVAAGETLEWTPNNAGVATGVYYLRGRTWDKAGNASPWATLFTFRYDGTPPPNPSEATHLDGPKNDTWQKITARPNFTWTLPGDEGSGVKGYLAYWGTDESGESSSFITTNSFQSATPLCGAGTACTGYLRLRSQDNVDWQAEEWSTTFVLRYDGAPPVAAFTVNGGVTQTAQTLVTLNLNATDAGSGLREMRFSADGQGWTAWEAYAESRVWQIPDISRQFWPIYAQVKDAVGWESAVVSRTVYLDVNVDRPRSASYRLFDWADVAGAGSHTSQPSGYQAHSTVGQVVDAPRITSTNYLLIGGYEAGSRAIPLVVPGHDEFEFVNSIFASGVVNDTLTSAQYRLVGVWGEPALPNNRTEIASVSYRHQPGFLAARPSPKETGTPTPTPTPGPTPTPTPTPDCDFPRVSIDNGALFTRDTGVTLSLCAPRVTEMQVSNDGGFPGAAWEPYTRSKAWTLTSHSNYVLPRFVYAAFKDAAGQTYAIYLDDIILDPNPPEAQVRVGTSLPLDTALLTAARSGRENSPLFHAQAAAYLWEVDGQPLAEPILLLSASAADGVDLYLSARDAVGNVTQMQVSDTGSFGGGWENYSALKTYTPSDGDGVKTVYARFQDEAGNASEPVTATFALDTLPPLGGIALSHPILGPDVVTTTVWLGAEDNLSGVAAMRLSTDPAFADAVWRPFASSLVWVYAQADRSADALHVQFRDAAGNGSEVYAAPLLIDDTPPLVYVEVEAGETLTRTVRVYSYDELTYPARMRITNDPLFSEGVVTQPYADTVTWSFDARRVVWVQVQDGVGNWSEPYPAYAEQAYFDIPGDCNNDGKTDAGDISALALEIFDQDGNTPEGVVNGSFAGNPLGCDANRDAVVDAGDISCAVLLIFNGPGACSAQASGLNALPGADGPSLRIPLGIPATAGQPFTIPIYYAGNGNSISSLVFSLDYDQTLFGFDPTDSNSDGIPDGVVVTAPAGFQASVSYDGSDGDGELDVLIADVFPPLAALPDGAVISVTLGVTATVTAPVESPLPFAQEPRPSFGNTAGGSVPGSVQDGSVLVNGSGYPLYLPAIRR